jgi:hypothetical protein
MAKCPVGLSENALVNDANQRKPKWKNFSTSLLESGPLVWSIGMERRVRTDRSVCVQDQKKLC